MNQKINDLHYSDALRFINEFPTIVEIITSIADKFPHFNDNIKRFSLRIFATSLRCIDTTTLLVLFKALSRVISNRFSRGDCPVLSPDEVYSHLLCIEHYFKTVLPSLTKYVSDKDSSITDLNKIITSIINDLAKD